MPLIAQVRKAAQRHAGYRCEYCRIVGWELQVEHIIPLSPRYRDPASIIPGEDLDAPENLAAACAHCNRFKGDFVTGRDPRTRNEVRLFHPRRDTWEEHFAWSGDYLRLLPLSGIGRATIVRLRMNDPILRRQRRLLRQAMAGGAPPWP